MGGFGRSIKRGVARNLGILKTRGEVFKAAMKARRAWCPKCERVCDSWKELAWVKEEAKRKAETLCCARCQTPVQTKALVDLPDGILEKGLWLRPGPQGWGFHEKYRNEAMEARRKHDEAGADDSSSTGGTENPEVPAGPEVDTGDTGEPG